MPRDAHRVAIRGAFARSVEREAFLTLVLAMLFVFLVRTMPYQLVADSWLALVAGREVLDNGLPTHNTLTVWAEGVEWVDQQWLAHVVLYALAAVGGVKLALFANASIIAASFVSGALAARRLGGSARSVAFTALPCMFAALWAYQLRAQTLAYPLFVGVFWLLASDSRRPSRRVVLVLPLLVLWANVHGSALIGAGLVGLYGATVLARRAASGARPEAAVTLRAAVVTVAAPVCLLASPYGLSLVDYYRSVVLNPTLSRLVVEWQPSTPSAMTAAFFLTAGGAIWLVARHGALLTPFERLALAATMVSGLLAIRSIVWFALASLMLLPALVDAAFPVREPAKRRLSYALTAFALIGAVAAFIDAARLPVGWYSQNLSAGALAAVANATARDPALHVFATEPYADWLLWERPELARRVAFDVRFELFSESEFRKVVDLYDLRRGWRESVDGYDIVVLEPQRHRVRNALLADGTASILYADSDATVVLRKPRS